jgi:hypothetical protein
MPDPSTRVPNAFLNNLWEVVKHASEQQPEVLTGNSSYGEALALRHFSSNGYILASTGIQKSRRGKENKEREIPLRVLSKQVNKGSRWRVTRATQS